MEDPNDEFVERLNAAHMVTVNRQAERIRELEAALVKYGHHIRNPCTASIDSRCVCGFAAATQFDARDVT